MPYVEAGAKRGGIAGSPTVVRAPLRGRCGLRGLASLSNIKDKEMEAESFSTLFPLATFGARPVVIIGTLGTLPKSPPCVLSSSYRQMAAWGPLSRRHHSIYRSIPHSGLQSSSRQQLVELSCTISTSSGWSREPRS